MNREQLFTNLVEQTPDMAEMGEFDRSPLEGYVTGEMAADLLAVKNEEMTYDELAAKQAGVLEAAAPLIAANSDPYVGKTIHMDMLFMFGSYIPAGEDMYRVAPPALMSHIQQQSDRLGIESFITYDLIVDHNSEEYLRTGVMRTFTGGTVGMNERDFYLGHHLAEPYARNAAYKLHGLAEQPTLMDAEATLVYLVLDLGIQQEKS
jgi:hypothetical protein